MNKTIFIILLAVASLTLTACPSGNDGGGPGPFIGGSEGLTMQFALGAPPDEIYDAGQYPFSVNVIIENVGERDVLSDEAQVKLVGIEPGMFKVTDADIHSFLPQDLRGAAKLSDGTQVPGDITTVVFPEEGQLIYQPDLYGTDEILMRAEICYDYQTKSTTQVCIKDNILDNINNDKICVVSEDKLPQNSGAPLHVSSVKEIPQGKHNVQVTFTIEHVGSGLFFDPDAPGNWGCSDSVQNPYENVVHVKVYFQGSGYTPPAVSCPIFRGGNEGTVMLFQGSPRDISCTIEGDASKDRIYQDLLHIDLDYKYLNYIEKPLIIRDVTREDRTTGTE
jgi:hypothetical protein